MSTQTEHTPDLRKPLLWGWLVLLSFFGGFIGWAALASIDSAAIASGEISVETKRKAIQHLEGGIIQEILVRDGDRVAAGQLLVRLDPTRALADYDLVRGRYLANRALEARLIAERDSAEQIRFPALLTDQQSSADIDEILQGQTQIFASRQQVLKRKSAILGQRMAQYREEIAGLNGELSQQQQQLALIDKEVSAYQHLITKGVSQGTQRINQLQREAARIRAGFSKSKAAIARAEQQISETQLQIASIETDQLNAVVEELRLVQQERKDLEEQLRKAQDIQRRTEIRAPIAGEVVGLAVHTAGGVIGSGELLMELVPENEQLVVEARIDPQDIDIVRPGLAAHVRMTAFNSRTQPPLEGEVVTVSADRLIDERTGAAFFKAQVALNHSEPRHSEALKLYPGMQAEVMIVTGRRTPLEYLLEPLTQSINRALRES